MTIRTARARARHIAMLAIVGLVSAASIGSAQAQQPFSAKSEVRSVYLFKMRAGNEVRYNKNPRAHTVTISASQYFDSNALVCTPSGFGQKSRCYARATPL
jgi:hypothetical protein